MAGNITEHYRQAFKGHYSFILSQRKSKLRGTVREDPLTNADRAFYDDYGTIEMEEKTTRYGDTPLNEILHYRRMITSKPFHQGIPADWADIERVMEDPRNYYVMELGAAANRHMDRTIINAFDATAYVGKAGTDTQAFDTNMVVAPTVVKKGVTPGDYGLNVEKILRAKMFLDQNEVDETEERYLLVNPRQMDSLLASEKATSQFYQPIQALYTGTTDNWAGFKFIKTNMVPTESDGDDKLFFWAKSGMLLAVAKEPGTEIDRRPDKSYMWQVYASLDLGATRMSEKKVGYIRCDPATGPGA